jgi:NADPH-dependent 2,4-dienoyl-CoA reductase/sulfur reductase-like enzyme/nitrite reductase/ring-hydroxylating ferredoxin subunit
MSSQPDTPGPGSVHEFSLDELPEGQPVPSRPDAEVALLVRQGDTVYATGARCTHYGAPLADGLVVGKTIRCPWHHARFSLETGEALGAPALNPIACFEVHRQGGRVRVGAQQPPRAARKPALSPASVVILGSGAAGAAAAEALRREGYAGPVTLVGEEPPVDRPNLSKDYLAGHAEEGWLTLRDEDFYRSIGVERVIEAAGSFDVAHKTLALASGRQIAFGTLLYATGAEPVRLGLPGADLPHVHTLRTAADSKSIIARAAQARRVVVIGASFIGLEVAASLRARELEVDVVAPEEVPLTRIVGDEVGEFVRRLHEEKGVLFHLGRKPATIAADSVTLDDGTTLPCDLVVMGVGVRPRLALAEAAGLPIERGVVVDELLRAAPGVYAAGDVARYPDPRSGKPVRIEHWVHAERMGQAAARNILGAALPYRDVPFFWSAHYDVTLNYVGHAEAFESAERSGRLEARDALVAYREDGRIAAVLTVGRDRRSLEIEAAMERGDDEALETLVSG